MKPGDIIRVRWHSFTRPARVVRVTPNGRVFARAVSANGVLAKNPNPYPASYQLPAQPGDARIVEDAERRAGPSCRCAECCRLRRLVLALAERLAAQSELLSQRAERP